MNSKKEFLYYRPCFIFLVTKLARYRRVPGRFASPLLYINGGHRSQVVTVARPATFHGGDTDRPRPHARTHHAPARYATQNYIQTTAARRLLHASWPMHGQLITSHRSRPAKLRTWRRSEMKAPVVSPFFLHATLVASSMHAYACGWAGGVGLEPSDLVHCMQSCKLVSTGGALYVISATV